LTGILITSDEQEQKQTLDEAFAMLKIFYLKIHYMAVLSLV